MKNSTFLWILEIFAAITIVVGIEMNIHDQPYQWTPWVFLGILGVLFLVIKLYKPKP